jgi:phosphate/sulfate permease
LETIYLIIVIVLFLLAASDLVVGVSNDAVNFLNSAIGSRVAHFQVIMAIAAAGILVGVLFSNGMMEVARKGIFNPGEFYFSEVMIIFMAVMITDVLLLDAYNTLGLPTSTTVSLVFELLGASVAMASIKLVGDTTGLTLGQFINSSQAFAIISGILVSVVIAFTVGIIIQYIARIIFTFNFNRTVKYFGSIWGGFALTAMVYFLLIKGVKGTSFMTEENINWIHENTWAILLYCFIGLTVIMQLLYWIFKLNVLKVIVLVGLFSLAMAFAGNDLVNFIGAPIAGYQAFKIFFSTPGNVPDAFLMNGLAEKLITPNAFLIISGLIMVASLYFSKKSRHVTKTEVKLARQSEGDERFRSTWLSQVLVRGTLSANNIISLVLPNGFKIGIEKRFEPYVEKKKLADPPEFDLVRASVNLTVGSILIALGTSLKLPLSTTYVTFMVAMGTSLADKAWDRESAVYRISGVLTVIGGWFLTAFSAFTGSFIMLYIFNYGGLIAIFSMLALAIYLLYRTNVHHKKSVVKSHDETVEVHSITDKNISEKSTTNVIKNLKSVLLDFDRVIKGLEKESIQDLKKAEANIAVMTQKTKYLKNHLSIVVEKIGEESLDAGYFFVQVLDYMREMLHSLEYIIKPTLEHVSNNHKPLVKEQITELKNLQALMKKLVSLIIISIESNDFSTQTEILTLQKDYLKIIDNSTKKQIQRVKGGHVGTRNTMLFLNIIHESKNLGLQVVNLFKSQRDFIEFKKGAKKV